MQQIMTTVIIVTFCPVFWIRSQCAVYFGIVFVSQYSIGCGWDFHSVRLYICSFIRSLVTVCSMDFLVFLDVIHWQNEHFTQRYQRVMKNYRTIGTTVLFFLVRGVYRSHISNMWTSNKFAQLNASHSLIYILNWCFMLFLYFSISVLFVSLSKTCHYYFISFFSRCSSILRTIEVSEWVSVYACVMCLSWMWTEKKETHTHNIHQAIHLWRFEISRIAHRIPTQC